MYGFIITYSNNFTKWLFKFELSEKVCEFLCFCEFPCFYCFVCFYTFICLLFLYYVYVIMYIFWYFSMIWNHHFFKKPVECYIVWPAYHFYHRKYQWRINIRIMMKERIVLNLFFFVTTYLYFVLECLPCLVTCLMFIF